MTIDIPKITQWFQSNRGDYLGSIWSSRNIDLREKDGYILPSNKLIVTTLSGEADEPTDLTTAFAKATGTINSISTLRWWTTAGTSVYETSSESGAFDQDDSGSLPTTSGKGETDCIAYNGKLYVADDDNLWRRTGTAYTLITGSSTGDATKLVNYGNRLYIIGDDKVYSMNSAETVATSGTYTLSLLNNQSFEGQTITCARAVSNGIWFATINNRGGRAKAFFWDGITADTIEFEKEIDSSMAMAMSIKDEVPYILDNRLVLTAWNGSYFQEVGRMDNGDRKLYRFDNASSNDRWIHHNGMQTINNEILMNINSRTEDTADIQSIRFPSGVYAYNPDYGIYHKFSHSAQIDSATYSAEQGQVEAVEVGALFSMIDDDDNPDNDDVGDFLVAYAYKSDNSTTKYVIAKHDQRGKDLTSRGTPVSDSTAVVVTTKLTASEVLESWEKLYLFTRPFQSGTDKIVVKYRQQEYEPVEVNITWVNTTSFTTTDADLATIKTNFEADVDYEVEGLQGDGGGYLSHVTNITEASGTYTVTIDETVTGATTNTAKVRFDRWKKIGEFTDSQEIESYKEFNPEAVSTWIQYKIYMMGEGIQLERFLSKSSVTKEI